MNSLTISTTETTTAHTSKNTDSQPTQDRGVSLMNKALCLFICLGFISCMRDHRLQGGAETPKEALNTLLRAVAESDYTLAHKVLAFDRGFCGGIDLVALNVDNTKDLARALNDHADDLEEPLAEFTTEPLEHEEIRLEAFKKLWIARLKPVRSGFLLYRDQLMEIQVKDEDGDGLVTLNYDVQGDRKGLDPEMNEIHLKRIGDRWYVHNFSCHATKVFDFYKKVVGDSQE